MFTTIIALSACGALVGVWKLLDRLSFKLTFQTVEEGDLSPTEKQLATQQNTLDALELDLAVAEELGIDPATLNVMSEQIDRAKDGVADAQIALAAEEIAAEQAAERKPATGLVPGILKLPQLAPAALMARIEQPDPKPAGDGEQKTDKQ